MYADFPGGEKKAATLEIDASEKLINAAHEEFM